jgi:hypothetical protein
MKSETDMFVAIAMKNISLLTSNLISSAGYQRLKLIQGDIEPEDLKPDSSDAYRYRENISITETESHVAVVKTTLYGPGLEKHVNLLSNIMEDIGQTRMDDGKFPTMSIAYAKRTLHTESNFCIYHSLVGR